MIMIFYEISKLFHIMRNLIKNRASIYKAERCLTIKTREVLRLWYWVRVVVSLWNLSGPRQRCCRHAGQMLEWSDNSNNLSPGFVILRHLVVDVLPISEYMQAHMSLVFNARQIETKSDRIGFKHRYYTSTSHRYLSDVDPRVLAIWDVS